MVSEKPWVTGAAVDVAVHGTTYSFTVTGAYVARVGEGAHLVYARLPHSKRAQFVTGHNPKPSDARLPSGMARKAEKRAREIEAYARAQEERHKTPIGSVWVDADDRAWRRVGDREWQEVSL